MGADVVGKDLEVAALELATWDGRARARRTDEGLGIEVTCAMTEGSILVLRVEPSRGVLTLSVPEGDLRLSAPKGRVSVEGEAIALEAQGELSQRAERLSLDARTLEGNAKTAAWSAGEWKIRAGRIGERAGSVLREVEHTLEERAGRIRSVARGLFQVLSERTSMRSKDNTAIDGKRVLLG